MRHLFSVYKDKKAFALPNVKKFKDETQAAAPLSVIKKATSLSPL
ncbi:hypothetical protein UYSO10_2385 [Kosakonia radicincitans]|nr:hypothetical protein UYSO10_2385 [Kosakonia radicincitans]